MNEFNFATPTAEGEYRAKAAKLKLPVNNFKKNNNNNNKPNKNQQPQQQQQPEMSQEIPQPIAIEVENPAQNAVQEVEKRENNKKQKNKRKKFDRQEREQALELQAEIKSNEEIPTADIIIKPIEELKPIIESTQPVIETSAPELKEIQPEKKVKNKRSRKNKKQEDILPAQAEKPTEAVEDAKVDTIKEPTTNVEAPKKTRRPNRGSSSRKGKSKKSVSEEKVEVNE